MAIAYDGNGASFSAVAATSFSTSFTVGSGSNRILFVWIDPGTVGVTSVTYNGVNLSQYNGTYAFSDNQVLWYLIAPATGSNTLVINYTLAHIVRVCAASYSGVLQSGFPDNVSSTVFNSGTATVTCNLTPVASNCWGILFGNNNNGNLSSTSGCVQRCGGVVTSPQTDGFICDTNGTISGSTNMSATSTGNGIGAVMVSIAPAGAAANKSNFLAFM